MKAKNLKRLFCLRSRNLNLDPPDGIPKKPVHRNRVTIDDESLYSFLRKQRAHDLGLRSMTIRCNCDEFF